MRLLTPIKSVALTTLMLAMAACATPPDQLTDARETYEEARQGQAAEYAPAELSEAGLWLKKAEAAYDDEGDEPLTRSLAYVAKRKAQQAQVQADLYLATERKKSGEQELARVGAEQRKMLETERDRLLQALAQRETLMRMTAQELADTQGQLAMMREELADAREQGNLTVVEIERETGRLDRLASMLEEERQARMSAEEDLKAKEAEIARLQKELEGIATVEQGRDRTVITLDEEVLFEFDKASLIPTARQKLNRLAELLAETEDKEIVVEGHTDAIGSDDYNEQLSQKRARSVAQYLTNRGIAEERINAVGAGEMHPVASNETPEGRAMNRRVEIVLKEKSTSAAPSTTRTTPEQPAEPEEPMQEDFEEPQ